jgi:hypothetical protein
VDITTIDKYLCQNAAYKHFNPDFRRLVVPREYSAIFTAYSSVIAKPITTAFEGMIAAGHKVIAGSHKIPRHARLIPCYHDILKVT